MAGFSCPLPMISKDWTIGMPADIMVASWRLKTAMSSLVTLPPDRNDVALCLDARWSDALAPQIRAQLGLIGRGGASADLIAAFVLALPEVL